MTHRLSLTISPWLAAGTCAAAILASCNDSGGAKKRAAKPPALVLEAIENAEGEEFPAGDRVTIACDRRITLKFGPSDEVPDLLDDWEFRPPGDCDDRDRCGYIEVLLQVGSTTTRRIDRASLSIVVAAEFVSEDLSSLQARLMDGRTAQPYLYEQAPIELQQDLQLEWTSCPDSGAGGAPPSTSSGGAGGAGGAGGEGGEQTLQR